MKQIFRCITSASSAYVAGMVLSEVFYQVSLVVKEEAGKHVDEVVFVQWYLKHWFGILVTMNLKLMMTMMQYNDEQQ